MNALTLPVENATRRPSALGIFLRETGAELLKSLRTPEFAVPTLFLPLAFYALFGIVFARPGSGNAGYMLATFGIFAALGPALFGFGAGISHEREQGVLALKQLSPLPPAVYFAARLAACLAFVVVVLVGLYALAAWGGGVELPRGTWASLAALHLASIVPFGLLGLWIGLSFGSSGALAITNIVFMALAVLGGLWFPHFLFPDWLKTVSLVLPSFHLAELALHASGRSGTGTPWWHAAVVIAFSLAAGALAWRAWHRSAQ